MRYILYIYVTSKGYDYLIVAIFSQRLIIIMMYKCDTQLATFNKIYIGFRNNIYNTNIYILLNTNIQYCLSLYVSKHTIILYNSNNIQQQLPQKQPTQPQHRMGSCLQLIFRFNNTNSVLRTQTLLNHQQLSTLLQNTTKNDHYFYSCGNLTQIQNFLTKFSLTPRKAISQTDSTFTNYNINVLTKFVLDLRDVSSELGRGIANEQREIQEYVKKNMENKHKRTSNILQKQEHKNSINNVSANAHQSLNNNNNNNNNRNIKDAGINIKQHIVNLKLQVQVLLLGMALMQQLEQDQDKQLIIQIYEDKIKNKSRQSQCQQQQNQKNYELMNRFYVNIDNNNKNNTQEIDIHQQISNNINDSSKRISNNNKIKNETSLKLQLKKNTQQQQNKNNNKNKNDLRVYRESELQQIKIFFYTSKVVDISSIIKINLCKISKGMLHNNQNISVFESKNKKIIGQISLTVADFIYYNYLVVSDVVPLIPFDSNLTKVSLTTNVSTTTSTAIGFLSIRGQALKASNLEKDYMRIIKQYQSLIKQLQMCLQGQKGWEKLSQYKNSSQSNKKGESVYSDYSMVRQSAQVYRM